MSSEIYDYFDTPLEDSSASIAISTLSSLSSIIFVAHAIRHFRHGQKTVDFLYCAFSLSMFVFSIAALVLSTTKKHFDDFQDSNIWIVSMCFFFTFYFMHVLCLCNIAHFILSSTSASYPRKRLFSLVVFWTAFFAVLWVLWAKVSIHESSLLLAMCNFFCFVNCFLALISIGVIGWTRLQIRKMHGTEHLIPFRNMLTGFLKVFLVCGLPYAVIVLLKLYQIHVVKIAQEIIGATVYLSPFLHSVVYGWVRFNEYVNSTNADVEESLYSNENTSLLDTLLGPITEIQGLSDVKQIGEGSSAVVYKAEWLGITIALKCVKQPSRETAMDDLYHTYLKNQQNTFHEEAKLASRLRHPNITLFMRLGKYNDLLCIVNEYCKRGSLVDCLRSRKKLNWGIKLHLAHQAAKGLAFMHDQDPTYLHRDIKASNILVTSDWTAKIADFGISRIAADIQHSRNDRSHSREHIVDMNATSTAHTAFNGTWRWSAPEVLQNPNSCQFNTATDIYSFGVVLWEILTDGGIPFEVVKFDHQIRKLVLSGKRPEFPDARSSGVSTNYLKLIKSCWQQDAANRPSAKDAMERLNHMFSLTDTFRPSRMRRTSSVLKSALHSITDKPLSSITELPNLSKKTKKSKRSKNPTKKKKTMSLGSKLSM